MVHATSEGLYHTFHFQLEEEGGKLAYGETRFHAEDIQLQVVGLLEEVDDSLFLRRQVWEEISLDSIVIGQSSEGLVVPPHSLYEVVGTGDQGGTIVPDKVVAAF